MGWVVITKQFLKCHVPLVQRADPMVIKHYEDFSHAGHCCSQNSVSSWAIPKLAGMRIREKEAGGRNSLQKSMVEIGTHGIYVHGSPADSEKHLVANGEQGFPFLILEASLQVGLSRNGVKLQFDSDGRDVSQNKQEKVTNPFSLLLFKFTVQISSKLS